MALLLTYPVWPQLRSLSYSTSSIGHFRAQSIYPGPFPHSHSYHISFSQMFAPHLEKKQWYETSGHKLECLEAGQKQKCEQGGGRCSQEGTVTNWRAQSTFYKDSCYPAPIKFTPWDGGSSFDWSSTFSKETEIIDMYGKYLDFFKC